MSGRARAEALRVLMAGPGREVRGGVSAVVNTWYALGLDRQIGLTYLPTMEDGGRIKKALVYAGALLRFPALMRRHDILHVHLSPRASFTRKALLVEQAHRMGKKIVIHQHGGNFQDFYHRESDDRKRAHIRGIFAMADLVIVLSEEWRAFFADGICDPARLVVLHNGVIPPAEARQDYGDHGILYLGKLNRMKGTWDLLRAMPAVLEAVPDAVLYLCGDGETEEAGRLAHALDLPPDRVRFPGWVGARERAALFDACSAFVLPSYIEGMPMSLLEAMADGLAAVAARVGGIPQIIENGQNGLLIEPGDTDAIAASLIRLLQDEGEKRRLGAAGAETIRARFDAEQEMARLIALYQTL